MIKYKSNGVLNNLIYFLKFIYFQIYQLENA